MGARGLALIVVLGALTGASAGAAGTPAAVRSVLGAKNNPIGAPGRTLGLTRVTIPGGVQLALHHHPGTQVAFIASGVLTYTVKHGSVSVMRNAADGTSALVRRIGPGQTGAIDAGEWIVEEPTTIHRAANRGTKTVVVYLATLFPIGSPPSIPAK